MGQEPAEDFRRLILVGHEPDLGDLACRLIATPAGAVILKKAGLAMLRLAHAPAAGSFPAGEAQLLLLLTPKVLLGS
jgi:phosphohistidine phosphatase